MKPTLNLINDFLAPRKMAMAGASRNPKKFGGYVFNDLKQKGFELYPVNPNADEIQGVKCYHTIESLPAGVDRLLVVTSKTDTELVAQQAINKGIKMVWVQQGAESPESLKLLEDAGIPVISKKCIMMFAGPVKGVHGFHRFLVKSFGKFPKLVHQH